MSIKNNTGNKLALAYQHITMLDIIHWQSNIAIQTTFCNRTQKWKTCIVNLLMC